ncbi:MAG: ATPase [Sphingomonadales bacterium]|nr:ATPase [Sphingomonadales bacterium]
MAGGTRIVAIGSGNENAAPDALETAATAEGTLTLDESWSEDMWEADDPAPVHRSGWMAPAIALAAILGWTAFFAWSNRAAMQAGAAPAQWSGWITAWASPTLLVCVVWLLVMRTSRREAGRFADAARLLNEETQRLETRLAAVNGELSLAREFLASQSRDLESLGRMAGERLSQHADRLQGLIQSNGAQVTAIGDVSEAALDNMEKLRGQLPVIASSAKDVTNNIGNAGRAAQAQLQDMINGFNKLNEFGVASERQVETLRAKVDSASEAFTAQAAQLAEIAEARFATLAERSSEFRTQLDGHEVEALAAIRSRASAMTAELEETRRLLDGHEEESLVSLRARLTALRDEGATIARSLRDGEDKAVAAWKEGLAQLDADMRQAIGTLETVDRQAMEAARRRLTELTAEAHRLDQGLAERDRLFDEEIARRHADADVREQQAAERLAERLAMLDAAVANYRTAQETHTREQARQADALGERLETFAARMQEIAGHGSQAEATLAASLGTLTEKLAGSREALSGTDASVAALTDSSVRLLELIQASVQHSREDLPQAIATGETRLEELERRAFALRDAVDEAGKRGEALSSYVIDTRETLGSAGSELEALHVRLAESAVSHAAALEGIQQSLESTQRDSNRIAAEAQVKLRGAIGELEATARGVAKTIEAISADQIAVLANKLGEESGAAIEKAMRARAAEAAGQLEQAAAHAAGVSREAAIQLRDQLAKVNELAGNLETRVSQARQRAEEQVDNDFSRRVALITEALNSNAIDIARALDTDVTDTAWASYLKGDRGIFTRRAVRLLDAAEAKEIGQLYEADRSFRDHVSHYIHDFEAMLRQLLSTRDGHALGVTLLSSDMGKLYVALAQAIERFRN